MQVAGKGIEQDAKSNQKKIKTYVQGNIKGFEDKKPYILTIPRTITPTEGYKVRMSKHYKWLENRD